jgi:hypothetical protein
MVLVAAYMVSFFMSSESSLKILNKRKLFIILDFFTFYVTFYMSSLSLLTSFWYSEDMRFATMFMNAITA